MLIVEVTCGIGGGDDSVCSGNGGVYSGVGETVNDSFRGGRSGDGRYIGSIGGGYIGSGMGGASTLVLF